MKFRGGEAIAERRNTARVVTSLIGLMGLVAIGIAPRIWRHKELTPSVRSVENSALSTTDLVLSGNIQAIREIPVYARVDGYLKRRVVDIGDRVQSGQILAEIDTPEFDQQLYQAQATLAQARSSLEQARATLQHNQTLLEYNRATLDRWRALKDQDLVSQQDVDDRQVFVNSGLADVGASQASVAAAEANVAANEANVQRLLELQPFQKVRAPFSGIITARNVDNGALISSGSATNSTPLFRIALIDSLRIYVHVPQIFVAAITPGLTAEVAVREFPQRLFTAQVVSSAGAFDPTSRTLLAEVRMRNVGNLLRPGMYANVKFHATRSNTPLVIERSEKKEISPRRIY